MRSPTIHAWCRMQLLVLTKNIFRYTCQNSGLYVCVFGQDTEMEGRKDAEGRKDGHTHTQTMPKLLHPPLMQGVKKTQSIILGPGIAAVSL